MSSKTGIFSAGRGEEALSGQMLSTVSIGGVSGEYMVRLACGPGLAPRRCQTKSPGVHAGGKSWPGRVGGNWAFYNFRRLRCSAGHQEAVFCAPGRFITVTVQVGTRSTASPYYFLKSGTRWNASLPALIAVVACLPERLLIRRGRRCSSHCRRVSPHPATSGGLPRLRCGLRRRREGRHGRRA